MSEQTLVERVARALNPECFEPEVERVYGDLWAFEKQAKMRVLALAALKAIRDEGEYFSSIVDGMNDFWLDMGDHHMNVSLLDCRGMLNAGIDAAIAEAETK